MNLFRRPFVNVKMKYQSSRGGSRGSTFESVLFAGYAPDGGLFVPSTIPSISRQELKVRAVKAKVEINSDHIIRICVVGCLFVPSTIPSISRQELKVRAIEAKVEIHSHCYIHMIVVGCLMEVSLFLPPFHSFSRQELKVGGTG